MQYNKHVFDTINLSSYIEKKILGKNALILGAKITKTSEMHSKTVSCKKNLCRK